jgi:general secretion pathway protein H
MDSDRQSGPRFPITASPAAQRGFTLVEILVVVLIIGIMLMFATLSMGDRAAVERLENESKRLEQLFRLALEDAEIKGFEIGFRLTDERYEFLAISEHQRWEPIADGPLRARNLTPPIAYALRIEDRPVPPARVSLEKKQATEPQLLLMSSGEATPFSLELSAPGLKINYLIEVDALGRIKRTLVEPRR